MSEGESEGEREGREKDREREGREKGKYIGARRTGERWKALEQYVILSFKACHVYQIHVHKKYMICT